MSQRNGIMFCAGYVEQACDEEERKGGQAGDASSSQTEDGLTRAEPLEN